MWKAGSRGYRGKWGTEAGERDDPKLQGWGQAWVTGGRRTGISRGEAT